MARLKCPYPDSFPALYLRTQYVGGGSYSSEWVECEARKDNGWYRFYLVGRHPNGRTFLRSQCYGPIRWKELECAFADGSKIRLFEEFPEDAELPDFDGLI